MRDCGIADADQRTGLERGADGGPIGVVILGPGRSGTSALSRAFVLAGFFAGAEKDLLGPGRGNPLGHFEPIPVLEANERILADLGCSWWAATPDRDRQLALRDEAVPRLRSVLEEMQRAAQGAPLVVKEPRINSLLPLWQPVIEERLHPVLALRDPIEIAMSHARRDSTSPADALAAWELQMALLLDWLDGRTVTVAPYAAIVSDPALATSVVRLATSHIATELGEAVHPDAAAAALDPGLYHEAAGPAAHEESLTGPQLALWEFLSSLQVGDFELHVPESLRRGSDMARQVVEREVERAAMTGEVSQELQRLDRRRVELERLLGDTSERLRDVEAELERTRGELTAAEARHAAEVAAIRHSVSWRITAPLRRLRRSPPARPQR